MVVRIGKFKHDDIGTYLLKKNPLAQKNKEGYSYVRESKQYGTSKGKYIPDGDDLYFQLSNHKTGLEYLEWARKQNMSNYNFIHKDAVSPTNLKAFDKAFRDLIQGTASNKISGDDVKHFLNVPDGKTAKEVIEDEVSKPRYMFMSIAPFYLRFDKDHSKLRDTFKTYGINANIIKHDNIEFAYEVELTANMPIVEFFQKVYMLSLYLTIRLDINGFSTDKISHQIERLANVVSVDWLQIYEDDYSYIIDDIGLKKIKEFFDTTTVTNYEYKAIEKIKGKTFKTGKEFGLEMLSIVGEVFYKKHMSTFQRAFRYKKIINRIVDAMARHSTKFKEKFRLMLTDDEAEKTLIKEKYNLKNYGLLHQTKHSLVIDYVSKWARLVGTPVDIDDTKSPYKYLDKNVLFVLKSIMFNTYEGFESYVYDVLKKSKKYKLRNINHKLDNLILKDVEIFKNDLSIVDYGSGVDIKLAKSLRTEGFKNVTAYDASSKAAERYSQMGWFKQMNILYPSIDEKLTKPDVLLSIEVIEHLEKKDRLKMLKIIRDVICPTKIILTTPNFEYNKFYETLNAGSYRHKDHKIEYTEDQFKEEVVDFLSSVYDIEYVNLEPDKDVQQSFFIVGTKKKESFNKQLKQSLDRFNESIYLPYSGYSINKKELINGYASRVFQINKKNIFFAGTTIAPVEYSKDTPGRLEHPRSAIKYYNDRGVTDLVAEKKYMGSRAYIIMFKDILIANRMGFDDVIVINSRNNFPFFENVKLKPDSIVLANIDKKVKDNFKLTDDGFVHWKDLDMLIYNDIKDKLTKDISMFDAEIMPWAIKGQHLVDNEFRAPAEMTLLKNKLLGDPTENAQKFIDVLDVFGKEVPLEVRLFSLIADADSRTYMKRARRKGLSDIEVFKVDNIRNGFFIKRTKHHEILNEFKGNIVKPVEGWAIDSLSVASVDQLVKDWSEYCEKDKGEGFVIKTNQPIIVQDNGHLITPMLKVRGSEYLRIIYGMDMYEDAYFERLQKRSITRKRVLSVHQTEISMGIVNSFMRRHTDTKNHFLAGFIGIENINYDNIDKTL